MSDHAAWVVWMCAMAAIVFTTCFVVVRSVTEQQRLRCLCHDSEPLPGGTP